MDVLREHLLLRGNVLNPSPAGVNFILNPTDAVSPRPGRRNSKAVFIVSIVAIEEDCEDIRSYCYRTLVRTLSNLLITVQRNRLSQREEVYFTTPEAGYYQVPIDENDDLSTGEKLYEHVEPIVSSHYVIENVMSTDLPERLVTNSPIVEEIRKYAAELNNLGAMPLPFPIKEVLSAEDMRHLYHIYGLTGLSYGNISARENAPELGGSNFWMTGRGVDKRNLQAVGKDILLVRGVDHATGAVLVSSPPGYDPNARVSIDAVEHEMIYRTYPGIGAVIHVHAWMDGARATRQNYPCGTRELAEEVTRLLGQSAMPERAVIGLKNHGLTITGPNLSDIFDRVRGKLLVEVPMFA
jgi:ribulose-5-phosphate 4-epimerase/fuculose-1-phosphate aldolase